MKHEVPNELHRPGPLQEKQESLFSENRYSRVADFPVNWLIVPIVIPTVVSFTWSRVTRQAERLNRVVIEVSRLFCH